MAPVERVRAGVVRSVNPVRRELRIAPQAAHAHEFERRDWLRIVPRDGTELRCRVETMRRHGDEIIALLTPGVPRDTVALLKGAEVVLAVDECTAAPDVAWDVNEWIGWRVVGTDGTQVGQVAEAYVTKTNAAFTVRRTDGGGVTLPAIPEVVTEVDRERGVVRVSDIEQYGVEL